MTYTQNFPCLSITGSRYCTSKTALAMCSLWDTILAEFLPPVNLSVAGDGAQALAMLTDERFQPDIIILDLDLPVLSGFEVLQRNPRKDIPVVVFSASVRTSDKQRTLSLGAKEYVYKPIDLQSYRDAVVGMVCERAIWECRRTRSREVIKAIV